MTSSEQQGPPKDRVIEVLFDGEWIEDEWSEWARDGSGFPTTGWAQVEDGYIMPPEEEWDDWREATSDRQ